MDGHYRGGVVPSYNYPPAVENPRPDPFGLAEIADILRRRWPLVLLVAAVVSAATFAFMAAQPRRYEASALILITPQTPRAAPGQPAPAAPQLDPTYVNSQVALLKSQAMVGRLVDTLKLNYDPEWNPSRSARDADRGRGKAMAAVARAIDVHRQDQTDVIVVAARAGAPQTAMRMANTLADTYMQWRTAARMENAERTGAWISGRLNDLRRDLQQKEAAVEAYRAQTGLLTANGVPLGEQQISNVDTSMLTAQAELAEKQARYSQLQRAISAGRSPEEVAGLLGDNQTMVQLRGRQADAARKLAELQQHYGDRFPPVVSARAELADINEQVKAEIGRQAANLKNEAIVAQTRVATLKGNLADARGELITNNAALVHLRELDRESTAARNVYESFLQRFNEVQAGIETEGGDAQLVSRATTPSRLGARPLLLSLGVAGLLGLVAGVLAALLSDQMRQTFDGSDDIERRAGLPLLTSIPLLAKADLRQAPASARFPAAFVAAKPMSAFAESMRVLRTRLLLHDEGGEKARIVAISSALPGEGKTTTSLCLARIAALSGQRVLLIDCDLRRCALNVLLGIEPTAGIVQILNGERPWRDLVGRDDLTQAHIIPAVRESFTPEDVFGARPMKEMLAEVSSAYDLVILDCPPVLTLAEARTLASAADMCVLVARRGKTTQFALRTALKQLDAAHANVLGVAFNGVDRRAPGRMSYADPLYFSRAQKGLYST